MAHLLKQSFSRALVLALAMGSMLSLAPSCADNHVSMFIQQLNLASPPLCTVAADISGNSIRQGELDVAVGNSYVVYPIIANQLVSRGNANQLRAEPNRIMIKSAEIKLTDNFGNSSNEFSVLASGLIDPTTSATPTYGGTSVELIPASVGSKIRDFMACKGLTSMAVNATFRVVGVTLGGTAVESPYLEFPIKITYGSSIVFPAAAADPAQALPNCLAPLTEAELTNRPFCSRGADTSTDCRRCQDRAFCVPCSTDAQCANVGAKQCDTAAKRCKEAVSASCTNPFAGI